MHYIQNVSCTIKILPSLLCNPRVRRLTRVSVFGGLLAPEDKGCSGSSVLMAFNLSPKESCTVVQESNWLFYDCQKMISTKQIKRLNSSSATTALQLNIALSKSENSSPRVRKFTPLRSVLLLDYLTKIITHEFSHLFVNSQARSRDCWEGIWNNRTKIIFPHLRYRFFALSWSWFLAWSTWHHLARIQHCLVARDFRCFDLTKKLSYFFYSSSQHKRSFQNMV